MARLIALFGGLSGVLAGYLPEAHAGLWTPDAPAPFRLNPQGQLQELVYIPVFKSLLDERFNAMNPAAPLQQEGRLTPRGQWLAQLPGAPARGTATLDADAALLRSSLQLRVGQVQEAIQTLQPFARSRKLDYRLLTQLTLAYATRGDFDEALRIHAVALFDADPPESLPGYSPDLVPTLLRIQKDLFGKRLRQRRQEASRRVPPEDQTPPDLFGTAEAPLRWINEQGQYEPGQLAAAERAKLPPDAIAQVQLLLLWSPEDTPLLWVLAELYASQGRFREAEQVFDQLSWGRNFTNRKQLMEHRNLVREALQRQPAPAEEILNLPDLPSEGTAEPPPGPSDEEKWQALKQELIPAATALLLLSLVGLGLFVRLWVRRLRRA